VVEYFNNTRTYTMYCTAFWKRSAGRLPATFYLQVPALSLRTLLPVLVIYYSHHNTSAFSFSFSCPSECPTRRRTSSFTDEPPIRYPATKPKGHGMLGRGYIWHNSWAFLESIDLG
jgi:hypothetical protein